MIISSFSSLVDGVLKAVNDENSNENKSLEISIPKDKYAEYCNTFELKECILPTKEEAEESYKLKSDKLNKFSLRLHLDLLVNSDSSNIYRIVNDDFDYMGTIEFLSGHDIGVDKESMIFFNAVYYSYVYLKKPIGHSKSNLDNLAKVSDDYIPKLKERLKDTQCLLGRLSLYKEAFKKLNMPKDLELCESNFNDASKLSAMIVFLIELIKQIDN